MSKPVTPAQRIVQKVLHELFYDRRGLTHMWDSIDADVKKQIRRALVAAVQNEIDKPEGTKCGN